MNYEKKYKNALTIARSRFKIEKDESVLTCLGMMFPELRESEEEMTRKKAIAILKQQRDYWSYDGPIDKFPPATPRKDLVDAIDVALSYLEKQKEQKPAEWSDEDEKMLADIIFKLAGFMGNGKNIAWLKSLRPQPQGTYKLIVHNIYEMLKDKDFFDITPSHRVSLLNDIRVRCKNADEQAEILDVPSWKPSEEQMKALEVAFRKDGDDNYRNAINSLYNDLKKL